jgi:hypothetical protein
MFVGFWPKKKKKEMLGNNLRKLLKAFETADDALKCMSMK